MDPDADDAVEIQERSNARLTRRGRIIVVLTVLALVVATPVVAGYVYLRSIGLYGASDPGAPVEVVIPEGTGVARIGSILEDAGVIRSGFGFRVAVFLEGGAENIKAGRYQLHTGLTARDALAALLGETPGSLLEFAMVTYPEGSWLDEFARITARSTHITRREFLAAAASGDIRSRFQPRKVDTLEGLMFPSTYQVIEDDTAEGLVQRLVDEFDKRMVALDLDKAEPLNLTPYEIVIVASMIEAETRIDDERRKVARVIYNRLRNGMTLGIDATVLYALGDRRAPLTSSNLQIDSPYNTRRVAGLPPTPIGAPGVASLEAALEPADGDLLYYVLSDCEGRHAFSSNEAQFARDKAAYQSLDC